MLIAGGLVVRPALDEPEHAPADRARCLEGGRRLLDHPFGPGHGPAALPKGACPVDPTRRPESPNLSMRHLGELTGGPIPRTGPPRRSGASMKAACRSERKMPRVCEPVMTSRHLDGDPAGGPQPENACS